MRKQISILTQLLISSAMLLMSCSKDGDNALLDLSTTNATYVRIYTPSHQKYTMEGPKSKDESKYPGIQSETEWGYSAEYDFFSKLPNNTKIKIGEHTVKLSSYSDREYNITDYIYCDLSIEWDETYKYFFIFNNNAICQYINERHVENLILSRTYTGYNFKGNEELERKYAQDLQILGTTEETILDQSYGDKIKERINFSVYDKYSDVESDASYFLHEGQYLIEIYQESDLIIHPILRSPTTKDLGEFMLTETESPSLR